MARIDLVDESDGENRAVRSFLSQYSCDNSITIGGMRRHMELSGWEDCWPGFVNVASNDKLHLTKGGAQYWIRYLFDLEKTEPESDSSRINFVEAHPEMNLRKYKNHWSFVGFTNYEYPTFKTLREAIDEAMVPK